MTLEEINQAYEEEIQKIDEPEVQELEKKSKKKWILSLIHI